MMQSETESSAAERCESEGSSSTTTEMTESTFSIQVREAEEQQQEERKLSVLMEKYPDKIPVKINYDRNIPEEYRYYRIKYMVSKDITIGTFVTLLRMKYMKLPSSKAIFYLVNGKHIPRPSDSIGEVYHRFKSDDFIMYLSISMENVFGAMREASADP